MSQRSRSQSVDRLAIKLGGPGDLTLSPRPSLTVPNSGRPRAPACAPRAPPPVLGSQWARGGGRPGRSETTKGVDRAAEHPAAGALSGGRTDAAQRQDHSARGPVGRGAMLRVRCLRGGSRGAEAVHYIGSRVRAPPALSPRFPQPALPDHVPSSLSLGSSASRASAGCREISGIPVGATPRGYSCSLRVVDRGGR